VIRIDFSDNKVEAWLTIQASGDDFPTLEDIQAEIAEKQITNGLDEPLIKEIVLKKEPVRKKLIASGKAPVYGKDSSIEWKLKLNSPTAHRIQGSDRVDFKKTSFSVSVNAAQALAVKIFAESGTDGTSVQGKTISSFGKDLSLPQGRNTALSEDASTLLATINGTAFIENELIHVDKIFHVKGNVSYATGNIKFDGPVVIEGDVLSGFRVEARDSIYIGGNIEAANVYSHQGDITVNYGILGKGRAKILAGGNLKCGFIQDATIGVRKDVIVERYVLNSTVTAGGMIDVSQNEGLIRGGNVTSEKGITVNETGSSRNVYTELHIRNQGENESQNALWELSRNRSELTIRHSSLAKRRSFLRVLESRLSGLSAEKVAELAYIGGELRRIKKKIESLNDEEMALQKSASKVRITREIIVNKTLHKNVNINISGLGYHCDTPLDGVKIFRFKREIIIESLLEMEHGEYDIYIPAPKAGGS